MFGLEERRLRGGDLANAYKLSSGQVSGGWGQAPFSGAQQQAKGEWAQTATQELPSEYEDELL